MPKVQRFIIITNLSYLGDESDPITITLVDPHIQYQRFLNMKYNGQQRSFKDPIMIESRFINLPAGQSNKSSAAMAAPVEIEQTITLFPWVETIQQSFIEILQPYWLTTKQQIINNFTGFIYGNQPLSSQNLYVFFWGILTSSIILYFCNKNSPNGNNILYYFIVLAAWSLASACLLFFYSKIITLQYTSFLANISFISTSYALMALPFALVSCSPGYLKVLFSLILFGLLTYILVKNYSNIWSLAFPGNTPLYIIFGITNLVLIYLTFFFSFRQPPLILPQPIPHHNLHTLFPFTP